MKVGWHYLEDSDPSAPLPAAVYLEPNERGETRGHIAAARSPERLYRPYFKGNPPAHEIAAKIRLWTKQGDRATILNEPNLAHEQFAGGPSAYRQLFAEVKALVRDRRLYWAGMSPGVPGWEQWYDGAEIANGICVHAYGDLQEMKDAVWPVRTRYPHKPIWISEVNFGAGREVNLSAWIQTDFIPFLHWCDEQGIEALTWFAWRWPTPDSALRTSVDAAGAPELQRVLREWRPSGVVQPVKPVEPVAPTPPVQPPAPTGPRTVTDDGVQLTITTPPLKPGETYWRVRDVRILNPQESGDIHNIYVDAPLGLKVRQRWPDGSAEGITEEKPGDWGRVNFPMYGDWIPEQGPGPYAVEMADGQPSERVSGMGLPRKQHFSYVVSFERAVWEAQQPPPKERPVSDHPLVALLRQEFGALFEDLRGDLEVRVPKGKQPPTLDPTQVIGIAIHQTGHKSTPDTTWRQVWKQHVEINGWWQIGYHIGIRRGRVALLLDPWRMGAHVKERNHELIGVCFAGNYEAPGASPSAEDLELGRRVIAVLDRWLGRQVKVDGHGNWQAGGKACPGPVLYKWAQTVRQQQIGPVPQPTGAWARVHPNIARYRQHFEEAAQRYGLDVFALVAICTQETAPDPGNPNLLGGYGSRLNPPDPSLNEIGLMQVMPTPAMLKTLGVSRDALWDPRTNILAGARIFADKLKLAGGNLRGGFKRYFSNNAEGDKYADVVMGHYRRITTEDKPVEQQDNFQVGPGVREAMKAVGDQPRSNEMYQQTPQGGYSITFGERGVYFYAEGAGVKVLKAA